VIAVIARDRKSKSLTACWAQATRQQDGILPMPSFVLFSLSGGGRQHCSTK